MRVFTRLLLLIMLLSSVHIASAEVREIPPYAKWGRLAMQETKKRYPLADIVDYQHLGRDVVSSNRATETFKLWLRQDRREWAVRVIITFDTKTERAVSIQFREEPPPSQASFVLSQRFTPV